MAIKIALAGNPNCGKTTMFNDLTGSSQYVGNWPGVTVEKKEGKLKGHKDVIIQDLPGIYSLSPYTAEEVVTRDFLIQANDQETLTTPQLTEFIEKQKKRGVANIESFEIEKERRYASTAAAFILTLIGLSLSAKKVKGGMGINIGVGLALSFSYILFSSLTSQFAISGMTTPFIAMEIPNVVYLLIGLGLYYRASKF